MTRPVYVYTVDVLRWPDWCPDGWDRFYTDTNGPEDPAHEPPDELRLLADGGLLPDDFPAHREMVNVYPDGTRETERLDAIVCPKLDRRNLLSGRAAHRWARHARALGADVVVRRGIVQWEVRP